MTPLSPLPNLFALTIKGEMEDITCNICEDQSEIEWIGKNPYWDEYDPEEYPDTEYCILNKWLEGHYQLIGTIKFKEGKIVMDFDPAYLVEAIPYDGINGDQTSEEELIEILSKNGLYWENPKGEEPKEVDWMVDWGGGLELDWISFGEEHDDWNLAESQKLSQDTTIVLLRKID